MSYYTQKTRSVSIFLSFMTWFMPFSQEKGSRDPKRNDVVQNGFTSCFAHQTGSHIMDTIISHLSHFKKLTSHLGVILFVIYYLQSIK